MLLILLCLALVVSVVAFKHVRTSALPAKARSTFLFATPPAAATDPSVYDALVDKVLSKLPSVASMPPAVTNAADNAASFMASLVARLSSNAAADSQSSKVAAFLSRFVPVYAGGSSESYPLDVEIPQTLIRALAADSKVECACLDVQQQARHTHAYRNPSLDSCVPSGQQPHSAHGRRAPGACPGRRAGAVFAGAGVRRRQANR